MSDEKKPEGRLGTGMAEEGRKTVKSMPAYRDYQTRKAEMGEKPVSFDEWKKGKR